MPIPLNPKLLLNAVPYQNTDYGSGVVSNVMPKEGEQVLPMQFNFEFVKVWEVDMYAAFNVLALSQFRGLYIGNTNSDTDVEFYFPLTGYTVTVKAGYSKMISAINFRYSYKFYIYLAGQINDSFATVNVFAMNFILPPFSTFDLFGVPLPTGIIQVQRLLGSFTWNQFGTPLGANTLLVIENNLQIMLMGFQSPVHYSVKIQVYDYINSKVLATHICTNTDENVVSVPTGGSPPTANVCINYFFLKDVLNARILLPATNPPYPSIIGIIVTDLAGSGYGESSGSPVSTYNWTFSFRNVK